MSRDKKYNLNLCVSKNLTNKSQDLLQIWAKKYCWELEQTDEQTKEKINRHALNFSTYHLLSACKPLQTRPMQFAAGPRIPVQKDTQIGSTYRPLLWKQ